ncbi:MAG: hypothetical protein H7Z12_13290 [Rhodospirillaceae bacterium]|nr:hypothetical protein [Rhodospirillales bacterium]
MQDISGSMKSQFALYQGTSANALLRIKYAQAERLKQTYKDIGAKYDGAESRRAADKMTQAGDAKVQVADQGRALEASLERLDDIKLQFAAMATAKSTTSTAAWDLAYDSMQNYAGSSTTAPNNLAGRLSDGSGGFRETTNVISAGGLSVPVSHHFAGADYTLELADGTILQADQASQTLGGGNGQTFSFANLSVTSVSGDQVVFHDSASGQDYNATLHRGGNGLMNGWFYNGFNAEGSARAQEDLEAANHYVMSVQTEWQITKGQMDGLVKKIGTQFDTAKANYEKISLEEIDAKNAEYKAAKAKFDLTTNLLSLTSGSATNMIEKMFLTDTSFQKSSLFDVISSA